MCPQPVGALVNLGSLTPAGPGMERKEEEERQREQRRAGESLSHEVYFAAVTTAIKYSSASLECGRRRWPWHI